jgi:hypothetical protein
VKKMQKKINKVISFFLAGVCAPALLLAQAPPPPMGPGELDNLVQRIVLYPDALLANILTASTYPDQIPEADQWADQHAALHGDALAHAIAEDHLPWDSSVQALLPFPQALEIMASDISWTQKLGNAVLAQRPDVMDAVQRMRQASMRYGYLRTNGYYSVATAGGFIEINPINPGVFVVPVYSPGLSSSPLGPALPWGPRFPSGLGSRSAWHLRRGAGDRACLRVSTGAHTRYSSIITNGDAPGRTAALTFIRRLCRIMRGRIAWKAIEFPRHGVRKSGAGHNLAGDYSSVFASVTAFTGSARDKASLVRSSEWLSPAPTLNA